MAVTEDELAEHLVGRLPPYMLPAAVMALAELPYTVSGKVDARALPDPFAEAPEAAAHGGDPAAPVDPVEDAVAGLWARILGVPRSRLDGTADFHRLGGDSVALLAMLAGVCGEVLTPGQEKAFMSHLGTILREPTLARVAELARAERRP